MTDPGTTAWRPAAGAFHVSEVSAVVGSGGEVWRRASDDVLHWRVKTRSGFRVDTDAAVEVGDRPVITARVLGLRIREPVEVVQVIRQSDRVGFAYRTLPGHPVDGEEAFVVEHAGDVVRLTVRSLSRAAPQQPWRALHPLLRIAQAVAHRRYLRALRS